MAYSKGMIRRILYIVSLLTTLAFTGSVGATGITADEPAQDIPVPTLFSELTSVQRMDVEGSASLPLAPYVQRQRYANVAQDLLGGAGGQGAVPGAASVIELNLFEDAVYLAVAEQVVSLSVGELLWLGSIQGIEDSNVVLAVNQEATAGTVWVQGKHFRLSYTGEGVHLIQELQPGQPYPEMEPLDRELPSAEEPARTEDVPLAPSDDGSIIDVLVVYTPASRVAYGGTSGILAHIQTAVAEANQAYVNSQINTQLRLVYTAEVSYTESGSMITDLDRLENIDGWFDEVHTLRNTYKADLVSMIEQSTQYCGLAELMRTLSASFENRAFSVVASACATGYYSFAHELAHNMGSHHDRPSAAGDQGIYPYSYGYIAPDNSFRTIMSYGAPCGNCTRVQYFSNPQVYYNGQPTGIDHNVNPSQSADNARSINNARLTVANFRTNTGSPPGAFSKTSPANNLTNLSTSLTLQWGTSSGATSYEYCLDTSNDQACAGGAWTSVGASTSTVVSGLAYSTTYYWQVRARNLNGTSEANNGVWWQFSTMMGPPGAFIKVLPADQVERTPLNVTLAWSASSGATSFEVCYDEVNNNVCDSSWSGVGGSTSLALSALSPNANYYWQVRAVSSGGTTYADAGTWWRFRTTSGNARLLLVDDDDNNPDVSGYYVSALNALGVPYDLWDTNNSNIEPTTAGLSSYRAVVWFSGDEWDNNTGPGSAAESALANYLDAGNCLFVSSQDYYYAKGSTLTSFMDTYLGVSNVVNDVQQTQVTGMDGLSSLGTVSLSYPTGFYNYSDKVFPDANAGMNWRGKDNDPAGVYKDSGAYRSTYWGFPFEALSSTVARNEAMRKILNWCSPGFASPLVINELDPGAVDAIEIYNAGDSPIALDGWKILNYDSTGALFLTYTFPTFTLAPGAYVMVYEGYAANTTSELYVNGNFSWLAAAGAAALVDPRDVTADFLRWGSSSVTSMAGTYWMGDNPAAPEAGKTLGRDSNSRDTDQGSDWYVLGPTLGAQNQFDFPHLFYLPMIRKGGAPDPLALPGPGPVDEPQPEEPQPEEPKPITPPDLDS